MSDVKIKQINVFGETDYKGPEVPVDVNSNKSLKLETENFTTYLQVRIRNYANENVEPDHHEAALAYFNAEHHQNDSLSVQFLVTFKKDVSGNQLQWGNDWDNPIRDILPWGFSAAFSAFKYAIDPGVHGDPYADKPYIYGPALSSVNYIHKLEEGEEPEEMNGPIEEPEASTRYKKYLNQEELKNFTFKKGETYAFDFSNPYLDMSTSPKIKMPGFTFDVGRYAGLTQLRYVLKCDDELIFAVVFEAVPENS